jgi:hypothetical protein
MASLHTTTRPVKTARPARRFGAGILAALPVYQADYTAADASWWAAESDADENAHYDALAGESAALARHEAGLCAWMVTDIHPTPDPIDPPIEVARVSIRPDILRFTLTEGWMTVGLNPGERHTVVNAATEAKGRAQHRGDKWQAAEAAGIEAGRKMIRVLMAARTRNAMIPIRPRPEPMPMPVILPLSGGAPIEFATPVRPDPRRRVVRGWGDADQAAHGAL